MLLFLKASLDQTAHTPCWNSFPGSQQVRFVTERPGAPCFLNPSSAFMAFGSGRHLCCHPAPVTYRPLPGTALHTTTGGYLSLVKLTRHY